MCGEFVLSFCIRVVPTVIKLKIAKFSAQKYLQGKNKDRTVVGHIKELLGLLEFHPSVGNFEIVWRLKNS